MTPNELLVDIEKMDFDYFMDKALDRVPVGIDTREGAIIHDALAPAAYSMAELAMLFHHMFIDTYTQTAGGEFLDYRATERGMRRRPATFCVVKGKFTNTEGDPFELEMGTRFASLGVEPIYYKVIEKVSEGMYHLAAEVAGNSANRYVGQILPIDNMNDFGHGAIISVEIPARDEEDDESLRRRIMSYNTFTQYGGNVADYITAVRDIEDVGAVQVYPTWNGGGTVKLVILNNDFLTPSQSLLDKVQGLIDPQDARAEGYGIAPIGHFVSVVAPTSMTIKFDVAVDLESGYSSDDLKSDVANTIEKFINNLRQTKWGELVNEREYYLTIYRSQLIAELLKVGGVVNVSKLQMNESDSDISLTFNKAESELPIVGEVIVNG